MQAGPAPRPSPIAVEGLAEIALPAPASYFPQAPGLYVVAALLLTALGGAGWRRMRARARNRYRRVALAEIDALAAGLEAAGGRQALAGRLPPLLKRVALHVEPRATVASLTDTAWLKKLDALYGGDGFSRGAGRLLPTLAYGTPAAVSAVPRADLDALLRLARDFVRRHPAPPAGAAA